MACKYVTYIRVSTAKQGNSGLGLEAQRAAVVRHADANGCQILKEFVEVESGRKADRPQLEAAIALAKVTGSTLLVAKLDRLSRNVGFLSVLRDSGVKFLACDNPHANKLTVNIMASIAEHEAELISERTKAALVAAKARGVRLGNPKGSMAFKGRRGHLQATLANRERANTFAQERAAIVQRLQAKGVTSLSGIAAALNDQGITTPRGARWHATSVARLLVRLATQLTT